MCAKCGVSFVRRSSRTLRFSIFLQFHTFITGTVSKRGLCEASHLSRTTLWRKFAPFFNYLSVPETVTSVLHTQREWIYGVDGKWLRRQGVVIIHRNITNKEIIYWSYHPSESYTAYERDMLNLLTFIRDDFPVGAVSDWKGAIVASVQAYLNIPHQRCLTHVTREAKQHLPKHSGFRGIQKLRAIACQLIHIKTADDKRAWITRLVEWEREYASLLRERTYGRDTARKWWYTHGSLRRGWRLLTENWDPFFVHLNHPLIPHSNNALEGTISQASQKLSNHRGMKTRQQVSFLFWYFSFTKTKTKQDLKKLWDFIKTKIPTV